MATIKKTVKKAQNGIGCPGGGCMKSAEGRYRREVRRDRSIAGERLDQKIMRGLGLATREGQERRQADRWARKDERKDMREYRRDQRRSSGDGFGGFGSGGFKKGGKLKKAKTGTKVKKAQDGKKLLSSTVGSSGFTNRFDVDSSGYSAGAKRFPMTVTESYPSGRQKVYKEATTRKGVESIINKSSGKSRTLDIPVRRASSVKKNKSGGKTSKRK